MRSRMPEVDAKEAALHRLLAPKLPVPRVIFAAPDNPITGHAYMLRDWADGQRLEMVAHEQTPAVLVELARDIGTVLAGVHSVTSNTRLKLPAKFFTYQVLNLDDMTQALLVHRLDSRLAFSSRCSTGYSMPSVQFRCPPDSSLTRLMMA